MADDLTQLKWIGGIIGIISMPLVWMHARQNRTDAAVENIATHSREIAESVARMEVHHEHIRKDIDVLMNAQNSRRINYSKEVYDD